MPTSQILAPTSLLKNFSDDAVETEFLRKHQARKSLAGFIDYFSWEPPPARHHKLIIDKLEKVASGECKRLMLFLPPGAAKSYYASIMLPAHYLARNPQNLVIGGSHTAELAEHFGRKVRNLVGSDEYRLATGITLAGDSKAAARWQTSAGGEFYAIGVGGAVTGRRADLVDIDDPIKGHEDAESETIREKTWQWYLSDVRTRLKPDAAIVIIQTRWNYDDLSGRILPEDYDFTSGQITARDGEVWEVVSLPALATERDILGRFPGESIWPEWFTQEMLEQERISQGPKNWSALYQQRPTPDEGDYFKREWIKWYDEPPKHMAVYGASDYAVTEEAGDFTVHGVAGVDPNDDLYILDWWRKQTASEQWIETVISMAAQWQPQIWAEEGGQIIKSVGPFLTKRMRERGVYFYREQFTSSRDKPTRAQSFRARLSMGKVYFPRNAPWVADLVTEMMQFPVGLTDDQVDVLGLLGRLLDHMSKGNIPLPPPEPPRGPATFNEHFREHIRGKGDRDRI